MPTFLISRAGRAGLVACLSAALFPAIAPAFMAPVVDASAQAAAINSCPSVSTSVQRSAPGSGKTVALTFDDGPGPNTPKVLEILRKYKVRATFFELGSQSTIWPEYSKQVVQEGHMLANHSWSHPMFNTISGDSQRSQLDRTQTQLIRASGVRPCAFRPPGGALGSSTARIAASRRLKTIRWTTDTMDWAAGKSLNSKGRKDIRARARAGARLRHPDLLMHDGGHQRPNMLAELPGIITYYQARGYTFVDMRGGSGLKTPSAATKASFVDYKRSPAGRAVSIVGGHGRVTIKGWAKDPDSPAKLTIRSQVNNRWITTTTKADQNVSGVVGPTGTHEFRLTVKALRGRRTVCVFADNIGPGTLGGIGCREVSVR